MTTIVVLWLAVAVNVFAGVLSWRSARRYQRLMREVQAIRTDMEARRTEMENRIEAATDFGMILALVTNGPFDCDEELRDLARQQLRRHGVDVTGVIQRMPPMSGRPN